MVNKKFKVIEEGIISVGEMKVLLGGIWEDCNVFTTCIPMIYSCREVGKCRCYSTSMYVIDVCEDKYGICGIVNGCGGKPDSEPYCKPIPCPNNCPQNSSIIIH